MTLSVVDDSMVIAELWTSLRSLILSYVAGHELGKRGGDQATTTAGSDGGRLTIQSEGRTLAIEFTLESTSASPECFNKGEWRLYEDGPGPARVITKGSFHIGTDSTVEFSDRRGKLELEVAAEAFTAKIFDED